MTMKLELSSELQAGLLARAQQNGLSLEAYAEKVRRERVYKQSVAALTRSQAAGQRIRELRNGVTLGGLSIRDIIEDDRE
jgi:hypothetical protein